MVTLPPEEPVPPAPPAPELRAAPELHTARSVAESFGADADRYDRARPSYPDALIAAIIAAGPGPDVLDVGCGTGIAARQFAARGCRVLGVDVDARMAEQARRHGIATEVATFEAWDARGRTFDAVVAGQAWHWIDPDAGARKAARVLRPDGRLAVFWNVFMPPDDVSAAFAAVYAKALPDSVPFRGTMPSLATYSAGFDKAADGIRGTAAFGDVEQWRFDWERTYSRDEWLDVVPTFGGHSTFPPAAQQEILAGVAAAVAAVGGSFTMGYAAVAVTAARSPK
jgi:SAM-dependent methyltransferase